MLKKLKGKVTFILLGALLAISSLVASGAFVRVQSSEYQLGGSSEIVKVAKNMSTGVEYYTVHKALEEATSGHTVVIHPNTNPTLYKNATVKTGVTLAVPIVKEDISETSDNGNNVKASLQDTEHTDVLCNELIIGDNITLTVNGTLSVYGQMSGGAGGKYNASFTTGNFSAISLGQNSKIYVYQGNVNLYGFIYEKTQDNNSMVELVNSSILLPVNLRDFKGGSVLRGYYNAKDERRTLPFDQMAFPNLHPFLRMDYGSKIVGTINLAANNTISNATQTMVANTSDSFIKFTNPKCVFEAKYDKVHEKSYFKFYSDIEMTEISMSLKSLYVINVSIHSSEYFYTIPWRTNIEFLPAKDGTRAEVVFPYRLLFLPGSSIKIHRYVTAKFQSEVSILDYSDPKESYDYNDTGYLGDQVASKYCNQLFFDNNESEAVDENKTMIKAHFINNGVVEATYLAGRIETEMAGSVLKTTSGVSVATNHLQNYETATMNISNTTWDTIVNNLRGQTSSETYDSLSTGTYVTDENNYWKQQTGTPTITFDKSSLEIEEESVGAIVVSASGTYTLSSTRPDVATVDSSGNINALSVGTTTIVGQCGSSFAYCTVIVTSKVSLTLDKESISLVEGETTTLVARSSIESVSAQINHVTLEGATIEKAEQYFDENTNEYVVTFNVKTEDLKIGEATIEVKAGTKVVNIPLEVKTSNTITLTAKEPSLTVDGTTTITATITGPTIGRDYEWTSSDSGVVNIADGHGTNIITITAKAAGSAIITLNFGTATAEVGITVTSSGGGGGCVLGDTLVTMWDGTQKKVQDLLRGDIVMSLDHELGTFVGSPLLLNAHAEEESRIVDVLTLRFSNGESIDIAYNHGFYDLSKRNYVTIDNSNVDEYIGDEFYYYGDSKAILEGYDITSRCVKIYAPFAYNTFNVVANGFISVPGVVSNFLVNIFEYDENMKINEYQTLLDIDRYGLFTYEDLAMYANKDMFDILKLQYLKIGIGKGLYTMEDVIKYLEYYSKYF